MDDGIARLCGQKSSINNDYTVKLQEKSFPFAYKTAFCMKTTASPKQPRSCIPFEFKM